MRRCRTVTLAVMTWALVGLGTVALGVEGLTEEEAARPAEEWTLEQALEKGWTAYDCVHDLAPGGHPEAVEPGARRWPQNDPDATNLGTCVTYSFMADGLALEPGPPPEGPSTWFASMPAGSNAAVAAAAATWAAAADIHFTLATDGGGAWNAPGSAGLNGNIRFGAGVIPGGAALAHGYYPPPNGVSAAGDIHFDTTFTWVTTGAAAGPPFDVETVTLHEFGHALGLDHVATVPGDIMFPFYNGVKRTLGAGDIAFMTSIYGPGGHTPDCAGACCLSAKVCTDTTQSNCATIGGTFQGAGTRCPTQNVGTAQHASGPVTHWVDPTVNCYNISPLQTEETGASDCCDEHPGPGCDDPVCEADVCLALPHCCDVEWNIDCALEAEALCAELCSNGGGCMPGVLIDSWSSAEGLDTCHEFSPLHPESPPLPAGFFEPGSDPFEGQVCLRGEPVGPTPFGEYGEADTLILRDADPFDRCDLSPDPHVVNIEIVALNLRSVAPIEVMVFGQPTQWEAQVELSEVPAPPGTITATKTHCNGGTYDSILNVQPKFTFTKVGGPGQPIGTQAELDTGLAGLPPVQVVQADNPPWSNDLDPYLNLASGGEECTGWHPGIEDPNPTLDCDCQGDFIRDDCQIESGASDDCQPNGIPDECEPDGDGDGVPDDCDNCPDHLNADQMDANGNGVGDMCEAPAVPTVSQWGLIAMALFVLAVGVVATRRARKLAV